MANKKNIRKWVAALRSGKYRQSRGQLHGKFGHCCLGVAEEICPTKIDNFTELLSSNVQKWLGIEKDNPYLVLKSGKETGAAEMNDLGHYSFNQIADAIERTYLQ